MLTKPFLPSCNSCCMHSQAECWALGAHGCMHKHFGGPEHWQHCTDSISKLRARYLGKPMKKVYCIALFSPAWIHVSIISTAPGEKVGESPANQSPKKEKG